MGVSALYLDIRSVPWVAMVRVALIGLAVCLAGSSSGAGIDSTESSQQGWGIHYGPTLSMTILGSQDRRAGAAFGVQHRQPMPLRMLQFARSELVFEGYHLFSKGGGIYEFGPDRTFGYGVLIHGRWLFPSGKDGEAFVEIGWGLQIQDTRTHDLGSRLNSTPTVGIGWVGTSGKVNPKVTLRIMHISSAGFVPRNLGQNQLQLLFGLSF